MCIELSLDSEIMQGSINLRFFVHQVALGSEIMEGSTNLKYFVHELPLNSVKLCKVLQMI